MRLSFRPEGRTIDVATGETLLAAARRAGVGVPYSCRSGSCGACAARLISGEVAYPRGRPAGLVVAAGATDTVLLCQAVATSDVSIELRTLQPAGAAAVQRLPARVARLERRTSEVMVIQLRLPAVARFPFVAGQYLDVLLPEGGRRSFSIASAPAAAGPLELHLRRVPDGRFTAQAFATLAEGALLEVEGPFGAFGYHESGASGPVVLVAGGTGFAPLKSILASALESGSPRQFHLYWGARDAADLYDAAWVRAQLDRHPTLRYVPVLSSPAPTDGATHRTGWVHEAVLADFPSLAGAEVYAAGPPPMVEAIEAGFPRHGLPPDRLHLDAFWYAADVRD